MTSVLVTGATGNVGSHLLELLSETSIDAIPTSRREMPGYRYLDFDDHDSHHAALDGIDTVFLVRPPPMGDLENNIFPFLELAKQRQVSSIVFLSILKPSKKTPHYHIEKKIEELKFATHHFLRAGFFMQNLLDPHGLEIRRDHEIFIPAGRGKTSFVDARDVALIASEAIAAPNYPEKIHVTGNQSLSYFDCAEIMTEILPFKVRYAKPSHRAFKKRMIKERGFEKEYADIMSSHYRVVQFRLAGKRYPDFKNLTSEEPISFRQFVEDHHQQWIS